MRLQLDLPDHMTIFEGDLYDTRPSNWAVFPPLRSPYRQHCGIIETTAQLKAALRAGDYTSLGSYPVFFYTSDGGCLHPQCVRDNLSSVLWSIKNECDDGWRVVGCDVNYEGADMVCDDCGELIESAYGDDS